MKITSPKEPKEKITIAILLLFFLLAMVTIGKGIYNQSHGINEDRYLVPLVLFFFSAVMFTFSFATLKGNNYFPGSIPVFYPIFEWVIKNTTSLSEEKRKRLLSIIFGVLGLITVLVFITFAVISIFKTSQL